MRKAEETNNKMETWRKQPTIIAKLMGLEALPVQHSVSTVENITSRNKIGEPFGTSKAIKVRHQQEKPDLGRTIPPNLLNISSQTCKKKKFTDVYEVKRKHSNGNGTITMNGPLSMEKFKGNQYEKRMALVHQKFIQAKNLVGNENSLHSQEFQDALEILSSNKDMFLRLLEEPNPWFSKNFQARHPTNLTNDKCITVLKPSKVMQACSEEQQKWTDLCIKANASRKPTFHKDDIINHSTRIVVLKPNPGNNSNVKDGASFPSSQVSLESNRTNGESEDREVRYSRDVAKEVTRRMQERLGTYRRDESLLSSVQSDRCGSHMTSLNRSLSECMEDDWSDTYSLLKTPKHSWSCVERCGSPCSFSSLSQASNSPESSVVREAKKHLSERWVLVASNEINQQETRVCGSKTLGRMLADTEAKKVGSNEALSIFRRSNCIGDHDKRSQVEFTEAYCTKSLPFRASGCECSDTLAGKSIIMEEVNLRNRSKSVLKGKISSLFSSKDKNSKVFQSQNPSAKSLDKTMHPELGTGAKKGTSFSQCTAIINRGPQHNYEEILKRNISSTFEHEHPVEVTPSGKEALDFEMKISSQNFSGNMEQPSPVSVLEETFNEGDPKTSSSMPSEETSVECFRAKFRISSMESIACSLSWDGDEVDVCNPKYCCNSVDDLKEEERVAFVQKLLSSSELGSVTCNALSGRIYSLDSPLDPLLLDKYLEPKREGAKSRQRRSDQKLLFDLTNFALLEIIRRELAYCWKKSNACVKKQNDKTGAMTLAGKVQIQLKEWFSVESSGLMVDSIIRKQVSGKEWEETMRIEFLEIGMEISRHILDELLIEMFHGFL